MINPYSLLNYDMEALDDFEANGGSYKDFNAPEVEKCTKEIDDLLAKFKVDLKKVAEKYPDAGIGDTATDECIAEVFYDIIHSI